MKTGSLDSLPQFLPKGKQMFNEHEVVRLKRGQGGIQAGTIGTIVMVYPADPPAYEVEFADENGVTTALLTLRDDDLERRSPN
jgi:uncharacterized protein DUF4926